MHIHPFPAIFPNLSFVASADSFFGAVREEYPQYKKTGFFNEASQPGIYIHQIQQQNQTFIGIVTCVDIHDYLNGLIKKHENTITTNEQQQMHLNMMRGASVKPVLLTYPDVPAINTWIQHQIEHIDPFIEFNFESPSQQHLVWEVTDATAIQHIAQLFLDHVPCSYIADGHHRTTTMALMHERLKAPDQASKYEQFLCAFFATSQLQIIAYNRVIQALGDLSPIRLCAELSSCCNIEWIESPQTPTQAGELILHVQKEWYKLQWRAETLAKYPKDTLDVNLLNSEILDRILGITDIRSDPKVDYVPGFKGTQGIHDAVLKSDLSIGIMLFPIQMEDLMRVADRGEVLPPKSTWFEPRMVNGILVLGH